MVVMSIKAYEEKLSEHSIFIKLKEAEAEALATGERLDFDKASKKMRETLIEKLHNKNASARAE